VIRVTQKRMPHVARRTPISAYIVTWLHTLHYITPISACHFNMQTSWRGRYLLSDLAAAGCYDAVKDTVWSLANSSDARQRKEAWQLMMQAAAASESPKHIRAMLRVTGGKALGITLWEPCVLPYWEPQDCTCPAIRSKASSSNPSLADVCI
jgi:hypothetical protein